ncbi:hypothetical protein AHAS_Ahas14G0126200 [Arachis hypogaea]
MAEMQEYKAKSKEKCFTPCVRTRGCPKNKLGSNIEKQISNASKKKKSLSEVKLMCFD